jgi:hypothetical protein
METLEQHFTQELLVCQDEGSKSAVIGIPKNEGEARLPFTPEGAARLVEAGFEVVMEGGAGAGCGYSDLVFSEAGAFVADKIMAMGADMVFKIAPPSAEEAAMMKERAVIFSFLQLDAFSAESFNLLQQKRITAFAYDLLTDEKIADDVSEIIRKVSVSAVSEQANRQEILNISARVACAASKILSDILTNKIIETNDIAQCADCYLYHGKPANIDVISHFGVS